MLQELLDEAHKATTLILKYRDDPKCAVFRGFQFGVFKGFMDCIYKLGGPLCYQYDACKKLEKEVLPYVNEPGITSFMWTVTGY